MAKNFNSLAEQEKMYDFIIAKSYKVKSAEDVNELRKMANAWVWNSTNKRMLQFALGDSMAKKFINFNTPKKVVRKVVIANDLLEKSRKVLTTLAYLN